MLDPQLLGFNLLSRISVCLLTISWNGHVHSVEHNFDESVHNFEVNLPWTLNELFQMILHRLLCLEFLLLEMCYNRCGTANTSTFSSAILCLNFVSQSTSKQPLQGFGKYF
ncbi:hypothetical protein M758_12G038100 [Ceratodon purpureus]|uniref:Uncharacterized protein n=1 Tax=Ceratodon purpureus TaxID=3225 RepID=A0A8T0G3X0_CERPU|nr:hypothetical protein KC19_12G037400 [Ceratodon purpureus]KAG0598018.1 hypothetical protein M758_12G038100 [Ceratodon purpureus]